MKKIVIIFFVFSFFLNINTVFGKEPTRLIDDMGILTPKEYTGYDWELKDKRDKKAFVNGYMMGYRYGIVSGKMEGSLFLIENFKLDELQEKQIIVKMKLLKDAEAIDKQRRDDLSRLGKDPEYYLKEIESFYQTFPLCKGKSFLRILFQLTSVWDEKSIIKKTYEDVGKECLTEKE